MKTLVLAAFGVVSLGWIAAAQKPDPEKPAADASKPAAAKVDTKQDPQKLQGLGYAAPAPQKGEAPAGRAQAPGGAQKPEQRAAGPAGADPKAQMRNVARMVVNVERAHRDRVARLERLRQIYEKNGAAEQLEKVARLRAKEHARYEQVMNGYEKAMGPELFAKLRGALDRNAGRPPAAPPPAAAPVPATDTPKQEQGGARQKGQR